MVLRVLTAQGDIVDKNGWFVVEDLELWFRDPVDCVSELLANPAFINYISYAPKRVYSDNEVKERIFDEAWMANWWWDMQVGKVLKDKVRSRSNFFWQGNLPDGAAIAPIILSSDKTHLSIFQGDKSAWRGQSILLLKIYQRR